LPIIPRRSKKAIAARSRRQPPAQLLVAFVGTPRDPIDFTAVASGTGN
jgi:hypothetical protein